ncbi:capsule biosynthesis protein [Neisseria dentiae]|uniref:capsule biosynthesis protein n=1 Tax=Neisseria dentiae TaxID=194197 RepID=UPI0035A03635
MSEQESKNVEAPQAQTVSAEAAAKKGGRKDWLRKIKPLFWATVIVPTTVSVLYFGLIASDRFVSESTFVIRSPSNQAALTGFGAILQNAGFARAQDDTYTVQEYMRSRTALADLQKTLPVRDFYETNGDVISRFNSFGASDSNEAFFQYFRKKVGVQFDAVTGMTTLGVSSFDAAQSQQINAALLKQGEALINRLNQRARKDTIRYAQEALDTAAARVQAAAEGLAQYRVNYGVFDLKAQSEVKMSLVSKLQDELIVIQTQLDQVRAITPDNPQISGLKAREQSLRKEIAQQMKIISGGSNNSLTGQASEYQRLMLENELAEKQLAAATTALETAKAEADRQQLYLEVVSQPSKPDLALQPKRLYNIASTFFIGLMLYGILSLLIASVREHKN